MRKFFGEHNLLLLLMLFILVPGILFIYGRLFPESLPKKLKPDHKLFGVINTSEKPGFDVSHFRSHDVQKYTENYIADHLPFRSQMIRFSNQVYYNVFHKIYSYSNQIIIGKHNQLIESAYISSYCGEEAVKLNDDLKLREWADKIDWIYHYYVKHGKTFVYIMTPSKAEYMPEAIPSRFHCTKKGLSEPVLKMAKLLDARKIPYVNGPLLMEQAAKQYNTPMFLRGGIHWNDLGASVAVNVLIDQINRQQHLHLAPLRFKYEMTKPKLGDVCCDLLNLTNLLYPTRDYLAPKMIYEPNIYHTRNRVISIVGGSFSETINKILQQNKVFPRISFYRYMKLDNFVYTDDAKIAINGAKFDNLPVDLTKAIEQMNATDVIVLEENSQSIMSNQNKLFYELLREYVAKKPQSKLRTASKVLAATAAKKVHHKHRK